MYCSYNHTHEIDYIILSQRKKKERRLCFMLIVFFFIICMYFFNCHNRSEFISKQTRELGKLTSNKLLTSQLLMFLVINPVALNIIFGA